MHRLSLDFRGLLVALSLAVVGAGLARADVIAGPSLTASDVGWQFSGVGFTANVDSYLTSFTFQNQGQADTIELVNSAGSVLDSVTTAASTPSDAVSVNWQLTAGDQYFLLQSTDSNSLFATYGGALPSDAQITMTDTGIFSSSAVSTSFNIRGNEEWADFNNITTVSAASPVPEPSLGVPLALGLVGLFALKRKAWWSPWRCGQTKLYLRIGMICHKLFFLGAFALTAAMIPALGDTLDANYVPTTSGGVVVRSDLDDAQTFTVLNTGVLDSISVDLYNIDGTGPISMYVVTTSGGLPSEATSGPSVLASATILSSQVSSTPGFVPVSLSGVDVTAGEELAIVLETTDGNGYVWVGDLDWPYFGENEGTYSGGLAYDQGTGAGATWSTLHFCNSPTNCSGPQADFGFETYVSPVSSVPEPSAAWLDLAGLLLVAVRLSRRARRLGI